MFFMGHTYIFVVPYYTVLSYCMNDEEQPWSGFLTYTNQGLKKGLVVAKKQVVNDFWLVVNGDLASCKSQTK